MKTFFILIFISIIGILIGVGSVYYGDLKKSGNNVPLPSLQLPYKSFLAGTGVIEAGSKNIYVGSAVSGIIKDVYIQSGDKIKKNKLLFEIDDSTKRVNIPILKAAINVAAAKLQSAKHQLNIMKKMKKLSSNIITNEKYTKFLDTYHEAKENLILSKQKLIAMQNELKLYKVYAPMNGVILRSNITKGSYFTKNSKALILGDNKLNIKVNINEFDSWKFVKNAHAVAYVRGNQKQKITLKYLYTIPFIASKKNLTGRSTEQTDTRVLRVVYTIENKPKFLLYVGEMLDVFIQTTKGQ